MIDFKTKQNKTPCLLWFCWISRASVLPCALEAGGRFFILRLRNFILPGLGIGRYPELTWL